MSVVDLRAFVSHNPDGTVVLCLDGELDAKSAPLVAGWVKSALGAGAANLVLDLRDVGAVDDAGLWSLAAAHADAVRQGRSVHLRSPSKRVIDLLLMTGLDRSLGIQAPIRAPSS
jgi:anti-sigma B factor antagonist